MAAKRNIRQSKQEQASPLPGNTCGMCAHAYGWCVAGSDGKPIFCRCSVHGEFLRICTEPACKDFHRRADDPPETTSAGLPADLPGLQTADKVVPLFRPGRKTPWRTVRSGDIPPGGILSDGTPAGTGGQEKEKDNNNDLP